MQMIMRENTVRVWYALYEGKEAVTDDEGYETGEFKLLHRNPLCVQASISPNKGTIEIQGFGTNVDYDNVMITDASSPKLTEETILWIGVDPEIVNGKATVPHNYVVRRVAPSRFVASYAIKKVDVQ